MARHERTCTKNPHRACGMCARIEVVPVPPAELAALLPAPTHAWGYSDDDEPAVLAGIAAVERADHACPACTLAALRVRDIPGLAYGWDYQAACSRFWADLNDQ